ncbi:MAG: CapA family protein [Methanoculleus sp.]|jgi:poly-gamma-glutamate synthesis protein (capsule biosynthesis protein)
MSLKIYAVGDIMLGEQPLCNNFGVSRVIKRRGPDYLFDNVRSLFNGGDIVFGNLECSIMSGDVSKEQEPGFFCAEPAVIEGLKNANFNVLSVANNHIMENKDVLFQNTVQLLRNNDILPVGIANEIEIIDVNGYRIAFLAYSSIEDNILNSGYNKIHSEEPILQDIQKIRSDVDLVIISLHWGYEYVPYPSPEQIQAGRKLVDAGADIILGGHPHVTQSYEIYKNRPIFYSLGNFIFDHTYIPTTRETLIAEVTIGDSLDLISVNVIPVITDESNYQPQLLKPPQAEASIKRVDTIRGTFEDRSLADYEKTIGDYDLLYGRYKKPAKWNMRIQFLKNFYRYSPSTTFGITKQYLGKQKGD